MSQKFSTFVNMINNKSNIEMQLATYKSMCISPLQRKVLTH